MAENTLGRRRTRLRCTIAALSAGALAATLAVAVVAASPEPHAAAESSIYHHGTAVRIAHGVTTWPVSWRGPAGPVHANVLSVNLVTPGTSINAVLGNGSVYSHGEQVLSMAGRTHAVGGVNGDFFNVHGRGDPWGGVGRSGVTLKSPSPPGDRSDGQFVVTTAHRAYIRPLTYVGTVTHGASRRTVSAVNTPAAAARGQLTLITSAIGAKTTLPHCVVAMLASVHGVWIVQAVRRHQALIRTIRANELALTSCGAGGTWILRSLRVRYHVKVTSGLRTAGVGAVKAHTFISGGRILVKNGAASSGGAGPGVLGRNPETLIGVSRDGKTVKLVVIDGRTRTSTGVTMAEASAFLVHLGCYTGMLMDGGYSTVMVAKPSAHAPLRVMNSPEMYRSKRVVRGVLVYTGLRPVADGLFIYARQ
jgi:hypothetical protein